MVYDRYFVFFVFLVAKALVMRPITLFFVFLACIFKLHAQTIQHTVTLPRIYAVVVGVNADAVKGSGKLQFAEQDAIAFANYLKSPNAGAVSAGNLQLLVGAKATRSAILNATAAAFSRATKDDLVIFYFSGHGVSGDTPGSGYLVPADYENDQMLVTGVPMLQLLQLMNNSKAKMKEVFIDACHAGLFPEDRIAKGSVSAQNAELAAAFLANFNNADKGFIGVLSSNSAEESREDSTLRHGIFTHFLIRGLKGEARETGTDIVTIRSLEAYLTKSIWSFTNEQQHPKVIGNFTVDFPMSVTGLNDDLTKLIKANPGILEQVRREATAVKVKAQVPVFEDTQYTYGYVTFNNRSDRALHLYQTSAFIQRGGGFLSGPAREPFELVLPAGGMVSSGRIKVASKVMGNGAKSTDYTFYAETILNGKTQYGQFRLMVDAGKEKTFTIMQDDLDFSPQKP
ncbi:caspase family protein [Mucilaginibacter limnophilus]|uniref:Caspase family protein n=1 Tax=Mucilaginibacter limnophilus TaxID=1932778 RepID=A0A3S2V4D9_9SPHI|nr:caspase family protein [Mucilaginibacter limnophilus]RVU03132.1 caspase family protein [Mucilaginibacter limnophilus]